MTDPAPIDTAPPAPSPAAARRWDPAVLPILAAAIVLAVAIAWLAMTPRPRVAAPDTGRLDAIEARLAGVEARPAGDPGLVARITALDSRLAAGDARLTAAETAARTAQAAMAAQAAAADAAQTTATNAAQATAATALAEARAAAGRPIPDAATLAALGDRLAALSDRQRTAEAANVEATTRAEALERSALQRIAAAETRAAALDQRLSSAEAALPQRIAAAEAQLAQRATLMEGALGARVGAAESALNQRAATAEAAAQARLNALEATLAARSAEADRVTARLAAIEARAVRLGAIEALRLALADGRPLGAALRALPDPAAALTRYATVAPPTEAGLRLTFEDAARAARAAVEPGGGNTALEAATNRLAGLVTIRRGEQVVWGDVTAAELERSRVALAAGDLGGAIARLSGLPPPAQAAMADWAAQAEALRGARAAVAALAGG